MWNSDPGWSATLSGCLGWSCSVAPSFHWFAVGFAARSISWNQSPLKDVQASGKKTQTTLPKKTQTRLKLKKKTANNPLGLRPHCKAEAFRWCIRVELTWDEAVKVPLLWAHMNDECLQDKVLHVTSWHSTYGFWQGGKKKKKIKPLLFCL